MDGLIDNPDPTADASKGDIMVPTDVVSIDGTAPAVGDKVTLTVEGTVSGIVDDMVSLTPTRFNGENIPVPSTKKNDRDTLRDSLGNSTTDW